MLPLHYTSKPAHKHSSSYSLDTSSHSPSAPLLSPADNSEHSHPPSYPPSSPPSRSSTPPSPSSATSPRRLLSRLRASPTLLLRILLLIALPLLIWRTAKYYLEADKNPRPWRTFCQDQPAFDHARADALDPVTVLVGVMSTSGADAAERRMVVRDTWARGVRYGGGSNVQVVFVLGEPVEDEAGHRARLEAELYKDIIFLPLPENMNSGKTWAFFRWASTSPPLLIHPARLTSRTLSPSFPLPPSSSLQQLTPHPAQYVVKADDDTFLLPRELERHLRLTPRALSYWGYKVKHKWMGGEGYALSRDLVDWVAEDERVYAMRMGPEDQRTADWVRAHPRAREVTWTDERCWIYDHPEAGTVYSHGFLYPSEVARIRSAPSASLPASARPWAEQTSSSVWHWAYPSIPVGWQRPYRPAGLAGLSTRERVEALVEGSWLSYAVDGREGSGVNETRGERMEGRENGGTVIVHSVKKHEWFLDAALAFEDEY